MAGEKSAVRSVSGKLKSIQLSIFCYQLGLVYKSGISIAEALTLVSDEMSDARLIEALELIHNDVMSGEMLNHSIAKHPIFPKYMVNMIAIGEATGTLENVLDFLSQYYDNDDKLSRRILSAVTYPLILIALMAAIIVLLFVRILPMFNNILSSVGGDMPGITRALMNTSDFLSRNSVVILIILIAAVAAWIIFRRTAAGRRFADWLKLHFGPTRNFYKKIYTARFSLGMSLMIKSGAGNEQALEMIKDVIGNSIVAERINKCREEIRAGADYTESFRKIGIFPKLFVRMLNIGFKTGDLDSIMRKLSLIYQNEVEIALQRITSSIEPTLVIILSAVVGVILLTVMLPLINIMSSIG